MFRNHNESNVDNFLRGIGSVFQFSQLLEIFYRVKHVINRVFDQVRHPFFLFFGVELLMIYFVVYIENIEEDMSFYDVVSVLPPSLNNVFNIDDIYLPEYSVNYDFHTHKDMNLDVCSTSPTLGSIAVEYIAS